MTQLSDSTLTTDQPASRWRADLPWLLGLSAVLVLILLPFSSYVASLPFIQNEWQLSHTQAGLVFSSYLVGYALSSLVLLPLTDRVPPRWILVGGVTLLTVSNLLFPLLADNFWLGSALRFLAGAGHVGAYIPGVQLVSARFAGQRRGTAVGIFVSAGYAGTTLSYTFTGLLLSQTASWRTAYFITALGGLVGLVLAWWVTRPPAESSLASPTGPTTTQPKGRLDLTVLRDPAVALVNIAYALHTAELYLTRLWLPLLLGAALIANGRTEIEATALAATLAGLMFMMGIIGVFSGGYLSDRLGRTRGAMLIFSLSGLCSFVAGWLLSTPPAWLIGLGFLYGFGQRRRVFRTWA
jgi:MFS family permease